jgi:hypothetical protein
VIIDASFSVPYAGRLQFGDEVFFTLHNKCTNCSLKLIGFLNIISLIWISFCFIFANFIFKSRVKKEFLNRIPGDTLNFCLNGNIYNYFLYILYFIYFYNSLCYWQTKTRMVNIFICKLFFIWLELFCLSVFHHSYFIFADFS